MKKIPTSILTLTLAVFVLTAASSTAHAVPTNKVPGTGYHDSRIIKGTVTTVKRETKRETKRKPYWKKKIGI